MKATNLKCEHLINPIGINVKNPRLSWTCEGDTVQTAYRITATLNDEKVWDSGKVKSQSMTANYPSELNSRQHITWSVTLWNENDEEGESTSSFFETGLLNQQDFTAKWITGNYTPKKDSRYPVDYFKKSFNASTVKKARLYITACGLYEAQLNGEKIGNFCLAPGHTDYTKRIQLQTYDVTNLLKNGNNQLSVELADGWYRGSIGAWGLKNQYGKQTKLYAQLELLGENGEITTMGSDSSWQWSNDGAIRYADNKDGETIEAFRQPSYSKNAKETKCSVLPTASNNVPITQHETFKAKVIKTPKGKTVLDFGQNIAGYMSFSLTAKKGQKIKLFYGEMLDKDGEFTQKNIQCVNKKRTKVTPLQQVIYTCKDGLNNYKTKFAIFGFQYVMIETDAEWNVDDFTAIAVYSDMTDTLKFECSHPLINKLVESTRWSAKNNHADVPTDCPTRERHGWSGDAQIFAGTASYMFDYEPMAKKFLRDMYDWQKPSGRLPQIAPSGGVDFYMSVMNGSVGWSDAGVIIPYTLWKHYGDRGVLEEYYYRMKKYAKFMMKRCGKKTLLSKPIHLNHKARKFAVNYGQSYGEWAEPADVFPMKWTNTIFPHPEVSTAYTSYIMELMCEIAEELGKTADLSLYQKYAEGTKKAYQALRKTKDYSLDTDRQANLVRPLHFNLLDEEGTTYARKRLVKALENYDWRLGTGFLSTPLILDVLTKIDPVLAYKLLENEEMPGWLFMPKMGATTIWESWEGTEAQGGIASLNHYSKGAVCKWLFDTVCGIKIGENPNTFIVKPLAGGTLKHAKASYDSVYGTIESGWEIKNGKTIYTVTIPANCKAQIILPNQRVESATAGKHLFEQCNLA